MEEVEVVEEEEEVEEVEVEVEAVEALLVLVLALGQQGLAGGACLVGKPDEGGHELLSLAQLERGRRLLPVGRVGGLRRECAEAARDAV